MINLEEQFCQLDDFCQSFYPDWEATLIENKQQKKTWSCSMAPSEIMMIIILFHQTYHRNFKFFYTEYLPIAHNKDFPKLLSYSRFVEKMQHVMIPMYFFMLSLSSSKTGIYFVDSTPIGRL